MLLNTVVLFVAVTVLAGCQSSPVRQARIPNDRVIERDLRPPVPVSIHTAALQRSGSDADVVNSPQLAIEAEKRVGPRARKTARKPGRKVRAALDQVSQAVTTPNTVAYATTPRQ